LAEATADRPIEFARSQGIANRTDDLPASAGEIRGF
jgi:hypothetical protein